MDTGLHISVPIQLARVLHRRKQRASEMFDRALCYDRQPQLLARSAIADRLAPSDSSYTAIETLLHESLRRLISLVTRSTCATKTQTQEYMRYLRSEVGLCSAGMSSDQAERHGNCNRSLREIVRYTMQSKRRCDENFLDYPITTHRPI